MEGVLAIIFIFGGGAMWLLSTSPVGKAIAERIRHGPAPSQDPAVLDELDRLRHDLIELQERMDFAERLLAQSREPGQVGRGE